MSYNITGKEYEQLYKAYLKRPIDELLLAGGDIKNKSILDISAGNMRLSKRAKELGCGRIGVIEPAKSMLPEDKNKYAADIVCCLIDDITSQRLEGIQGDCCNYINFFLCNGKYDFAFCQQGINYWFSKYNIETVVEMLNKNGKFIFNTFNEKPSHIPQFKAYTIDKRGYLESWQREGSIVYHIQMCEFMRPHFTSFKWIAPEEFDEVLSKYFSNITTKIDKHTTIYICEK